MRALISSTALAIVLVSAHPAVAQKQGGTLRMYLWDSPPSASIHEEATVSTVMPFMALFNNLVLYDQHKKLNTTDTIQPELATSWAWDDMKTKLTFKLRDDVKWHDGKPFTAKDVSCTLDKLQDKGADTFRKNPRKIWWHNLKEVTANGDHEVTFHLERPQESFLALRQRLYADLPATPSRDVIAQPNQQRAGRQRSEHQIISHAERIEGIKQRVDSLEVSTDEVDDNQQYACRQ